MLLYVSMAAWAACSVLKRIVPMPCTQADDALRYEKWGAAVVSSSITLCSKRQNQCRRCMLCSCAPIELH